MMMMIIIYKPGLLSSQCQRRLQAHNQVVILAMQRSSIQVGDVAPSSFWRLICWRCCFGNHRVVDRDRGLLGHWGCLSLESVKKSSEWHWMKVGDLRMIWLKKTWRISAAGGYLYFFPMGNVEMQKVWTTLLQGALSVQRVTRFRQELLVCLQYGRGENWGRIRLMYRIRWSPRALSAR